MILDEITLHNFGVYGGRQTMRLTPIEPGRPIVLVGGLNGGGKTTLLDALQLGLFGQAARCSNRNGAAYDEYLRRSIHRRSDVREAAIELAFRHMSNGTEHAFRVHRSWSVAGSGGVRERFHVLRDGRMDRVATEHWAEQVEDFIPSRIAHLFFFDGEKVESYADLDGAPALIGAAVHNLLGLDLVERLTNDLQVIERRRRIEAKPNEKRVALDGLKGKIRALDVARTDLLRRRAEMTVALDRAVAEAGRLNDRYRRDGGELFERRTELEADVLKAEKDWAAGRKEMLDLAGGASPLLLVRDLLETMARRDVEEASTRRSREALRAVEEEHAAVLDLPAIVGLDGREREAIGLALDGRLAQRRAAAERTMHLALSDEARVTLGSLMREELPSIADEAMGAILAAREAHGVREAARIAAAATPGFDAIATLAAARDAARGEVERLRAELDRSDGEIARHERELAGHRAAEERLIDDDARDRLERDDVKRLMTHSSRVRATLGRFSDAVVARHVSRIEGLVLESFRRLVRKRTLVVSLAIDPRTFALELKDGAGHPVTHDRLSAGERQLLAIALLWGLARASGRPLPTVIDTPLGRLDSHHRDHLVRRYFPHASHQVILLSTDEEIAGGYLDALRPAVDRTYRLRFDEAAESTVIEDGYFPTDLPAADHEPGGAAAPDEARGTEAGNDAGSGPRPRLLAVGEGRHAY